MNKRVLLGMSGGVDSSVSAILLQEAGYEVIGATMKLWEDEENPCNESTCCSFSAVNDAKRVCDILEIPHYTLNYKEEFKKYVIDNFINCYECAKTPNPCIECNKHLKFDCFFRKAKELGCDYIATGHYAKTEYSDEFERYVLKKSNSQKKDQTYFLYNMPSSIVENVLFPLAVYEDKEDVRKIAEEHGLRIARKPDSQEICFIPDNNYIGFLNKNMKVKPKCGNIVLTDGRVLGKHNGIINYTIGQRKGLGVSYKEPLYVIDIKPETNEVIVGKEEMLYSNELTASVLNWMAIDELEEPLELEAKIRYRSKESKCIVYPIENDKVKVVFNEPQRAITRGQSVVFYKDNIVIGGGIID